MSGSGPDDVRHRSGRERARAVGGAPPSHISAPLAATTHLRGVASAGRTRHLE